MMIHALRCSAAFSALLVLAACASEPPRGPGEPGGGPGGGMGGMEGRYAKPVGLLFVGFDTDHDLRLTQAELMAGARAEWTRVDADRSEGASAFEISAWDQAVLGSADALPNRLSFDADMSGVVTREEFIDGLVRAFTEADANRDGVVDRSELVAEASRMGRGGFGGEGGGMPRRGGSGGPGGGRRGGGPPPGG